MSLAGSHEQLLDQIRVAKEELQGPFGVTWVTSDHSVAQTGYDFPTVGEATEVAERGPWEAERAGFQVDALCVHYPTDEGEVMWGNIENPDETFGAVEVAGR